MLAHLSNFDPGSDGRAALSLGRTRALLEQSSAPFSRSKFDPGHITASGLVLSPARDRVLLVFRRRLQRWLQPGGHVEPEDADLIAAARREVLEETGVGLDPYVVPALIGVDVHLIPARSDEPPHLHHDLVFRFVALGDGAIAPEVGRDVRWGDISRLAEVDPDDALRRSVRRALGVTPPPVSGERGGEERRTRRREWPTGPPLTAHHFSKGLPMLLTTTPTVEGAETAEYFGIVTGEAILGANIFRDLFAGIRDIVGGRAAAYEKELAEARQLALDELAWQAQQQGADAVVGVSLDYEAISFGRGGNALMVTASGTAVRVAW